MCFATPAASGTPLLLEQEEQAVLWQKGQDGSVSTPTVSLICCKPMELTGFLWVIKT